MAGLVDGMAAPANIAVAASVVLIFSIYFHLLNRYISRPVNWPLLGAFPNLLFNLDRLHDWIAAVLRRADGRTFIFKALSGSPVDLLITAEPANVAHIFTTNFANYPKGEELAELFDVLGGGIFNADGDSWASQRKKAHQFLSDGAFRAHAAAATATKIGSGLLPLLNSMANSGEAFDLQDVFMRLTFDLTAAFVFGFDTGCLSPGLPAVPFADAMDVAEEIMFIRNIYPVPLLHLEKKLNIGQAKRMAQAKATLDRCIAEYISRQRELIAKSGGAGSGRQDLLSFYMAAKDGDKSGEDHRFDDVFLRDTTLNLMVAGRDTTSAALTWFFWALSRNPSVEEKIVAELDARPPSDGELYTASELSGLVYLHAALCESLRLYPPVPFEHKAAAKPDVLPTGTPVGPARRILVSFYAMARMPSVWGADCEVYRPERWISPASGKLRREPSYKFVAFNVGPRTCLGRELAFLQMKAAATAVLRRFRVAVEEGFVARPKLSIILHMKGGLRVTVQPRGRTKI